LSDARAFYGVITISMIVGVGQNLVGIDPIRALYLSAILNGIAAPPLILMMLVLSNSAAVGRHRGGRLSDALVAITFLVMTAAAVAFVAGLVIG
jgi:Mn2+/Fe2+ NRAMP family transporter